MERNDEALRGDHGRWWWGRRRDGRATGCRGGAKGQQLRRIDAARPESSVGQSNLGDIRMVDSASSFVCKKLEAPPSSNLQVAGDVVTMGLVNMLGGALVGDCQFAGTVTGLSKNSVGLSNVNDASDQNKPVSLATQAALDGKASLAQRSW